LKSTKFTLVDIRTKTEVDETSVKGAINIPMHDVLDRYDEFKTMIEPIIVFCVSGNRSGIVAELLKDKGIEKIINGNTVEGVEKL
jgi:rhodanese-related sulfurtransferase